MDSRQESGPDGTGNLKSQDRERPKRDVRSSLMRSKHLRVKRGEECASSSGEVRSERWVYKGPSAFDEQGEREDLL